MDSNSESQRSLLVLGLFPLLCQKETIKGAEHLSTASQGDGRLSGFLAHQKLSLQGLTELLLAQMHAKRHSLAERLGTRTQKTVSFLGLLMQNSCAEQSPTTSDLQNCPRSCLAKGYEDS